LDFFSIKSDFSDWRFGVVFMARKYEIDTTSGPLFGKIVGYSLPLIASGLLQYCYNIVNTVMLGIFDGSAALAAVGSTGAVTSLFISLFMGLSVGINVLVARAFSTKNKKDIEEIVHTAVFSAIIIGVFIAVSGFFASRPMLIITDTPKEILDLSTSYMQVYFVGFIGSCVSNFASAILHGIGDTKRPFYISLGTSTLHVFLNLLFIVILKQGVIGVAVSTTIVQLLNAALIIAILLFSKEDYRIRFSKLKISKQKLTEMMFIGIPSGLQSTATGITNTMVQSAINSFGFLVVAGNTAANNLGNLVYVCLNAYHRTALTFASQNYGVGKIKRVIRITKLCLLIVTVLGFVLGGILWLFAEPLLKLYVTEKEAIAVGVLRIVIVYFTHALYGWTDVLGGIMRGIGRSTLSMIITMSGLCGFTILWINSVFRLSHNIATLYSVYPVAWVLTTAAYIISLYCIVKNIAKNHTLKN
jgi:putative MATE family efflux protein